MVRFPERDRTSFRAQANHGIASSDLQHIVGWFDKWLMGMPKPEYEVSDVSSTAQRQ